METRIEKFKVGQEVIMTLPNGLKKPYWYEFTFEDERGAFARCRTAKNGKYFQNIAMCLLKAA